MGIWGAVVDRSILGSIKKARKDGETFVALSDEEEKKLRAKARLLVEQGGYEAFMGVGKTLLTAGVLGVGCSLVGGASAALSGAIFLGAGALYGGKALLNTVDKFRAASLMMKPYRNLSTVHERPLQAIRDILPRIGYLDNKRVDYVALTADEDAQLRNKTKRTAGIIKDCSVAGVLSMAPTWGVFALAAAPIALPELVVSAVIGTAIVSAYHVFRANREAKKILETGMRPVDRVRKGDVLSGISDEELPNRVRVTQTRISEPACAA